MGGVLQSIGALAKVADCPVQTIRYYEEVGLLPRAYRSEGGQRRYTARHVERLLFIRHCRELGFSLHQIGQLLRLGDGGERPCGEVDAIARQHLAEVEGKIVRLQGLQRELQRILAVCQSGDSAHCRLIETLGDHSQCLEEDHGEASTASFDV
ncbi:MAG: helix-turn-helix domain-containing protein [Magnetococcales bacterium]|nr:helix-turn-helix domain-containing protein [Magnetococcales bacterium]